MSRKDILCWIVLYFPCVWRIWQKCWGIVVLLSGFSSIRVWKWNTFVSCIVKMGPSQNNPLEISSRPYNVITFMKAFPWRLSSLTVVSDRSLGVDVPSALLQILNKLTWLTEVLKTFYLTLWKKSDPLLPAQHWILAYPSCTLTQNVFFLKKNGYIVGPEENCIVWSCRFWGMSPGSSTLPVYLSDLPYFWQKVTLSILLIMGIIIIKIDN